MIEERFRELASYDPETGIFRLVHKKAKYPAGRLNNWGYRRIRLLDKEYLAHRLAWLFVYGEWPSGQVDHINGDKDDNRIVNLRVVSDSENQQNQHRPQANNTSGLRGVSFSKTAGKWQAQIKVSGKKTHLGVFDDKNDAYAAYMAAKKEYHHASYLAMHHSGQAG